MAVILGSGGVRGKQQPVMPFRSTHDHGVVNTPVEYQSGGTGRAFSVPVGRPGQVRTRESAMLPRWRRLRLVLTAIFALIATGLLVLAYALIGRFPGSTVTTLATVAVVLPIGMYALATVGGWQRSLASGASPTGVTGWIIRHRLTPILPLVFLFFLLGLVRAMDLTPIDREAHTAAGLSRSINESCVASARSGIAKSGGDPDSAAMQAKAVSYCGCVTVALQREYTPEEFVRLAGDPGRLDKEERMNRIIDSCAKAASD
jgi:hypothetical protein